MLWDYLGRLNPEPFQQVLYAWTAGAISIDVAFLLDPLSAVMLFVVTCVGFLIHVYSVGYMGHEAGYQRYFAYLNLFMGAMLLLVLGEQLPGHVRRLGGRRALLLPPDRLLLRGGLVPPTPASKAFIVNRIGDFGFLVGMFALFAAFGTLDFRTIFGQVAENPALVTGDYALGLTLAGFVCLCLFVGAMGKSAQIPLYVWLPDAMAGPTPVSALIHAATMVTAGVYMVARSNVLYQLAPADLARGRGHRRGDRALRGDDRPRPERHQEGPRLLDRLAARLHVPGRRASAPTPRRSSTSSRTRSSRRSSSSARAR